MLALTDVPHVQNIHITEKKTGMLCVVQSAKEPNQTTTSLERDAVCETSVGKIP